MANVKLFGILNLTPDSFSDGGQFVDTAAALAHAQELISDGADYIDVGAEATNPSAHPIHHQEEWSRLEVVLPQLLKIYPGQISLDTMHPETARAFLEMGGTVLNDVSGFRMREMIALAAEFKPLCIINHFPGSNIHEVHEQSVGSIDRVAAELLERHDQLVQAGVPEENIILDPGIGFGKTIELNRELLHFAEFTPDQKVMIGHSRKRFLGPDRMDTETNLEAAKIAITAGAQYLRVHDVAAHAQLLK